MMGGAEEEPPEQEGTKQDITNYKTYMASETSHLVSSRFDWETLSQ